MNKGGGVKILETEKRGEGIVGALGPPLLLDSTLDWT